MDRRAKGLAAGLACAEKRYDVRDRAGGGHPQQVFEQLGLHMQLPSNGGDRDAQVP